MTTTPIIELKKVACQFTLESGVRLKVLDQFDFRLEEGDIVALLGASGSGKSTALRIMAGLTHPTQGEVLSQGTPLDGINKDVAFVFQSFALFPWQTVYKNIETALEPLKLDSKASQARIRQAIDWVGLEGFEEAYPRELSGGMKQRVGIARALAMERPILFLDEPFSALDILTADTLRNEIMELYHSGQTTLRTLLLVTHNIQEAVFMAKRILVMGSNPGHILQEIINPLPYPRDETSPEFIQMVDELHRLISETLMPDEDMSKGPIDHKAATKERPLEVFPNTPVSEVIGLLEALHDSQESADVFELSGRIGKNFGHTLLMVKAAELLYLVDTPKQRVFLTPLGKQFVLGDINERKKMLHQLFGRLRLIQAISEELKKTEKLRLPVIEIETIIHHWLPNENPKNILKALIGWGRFAEYFGYNDDTKELYLDLGLEPSSL